MEIPAWLYFSFWSITGGLSLFLGMKTLDKTDLSVSVSTLTMSLFKYSFAISTSLSSTYSSILRPKLMISPHRYYMWLFFAVFPLTFNRISGKTFAWYFPIYSFINLFGVLRCFLPEMKSFIVDESLYDGCLGLAFFPLLYFVERGDSLMWYSLMYISNFMIFSTPLLVVFGEEHSGRTFHFLVLSSMVFVSGTSEFFPLLVLLVAFFGSALWAAFAGDERFQGLVPRVVRENDTLARLKNMLMKRRKLIEFALGMVGTILFQNFFELSSFEHIVAFLYLSLSWLANIALLMPPHDFGIFNFFLTNVIIDCTASHFGLHGTTWLTYGASVLLYGLRLKLESLTLVRKDDGKEVICWRE